jgi:hydroxypyruvate isomerase
VWLEPWDDGRRGRRLWDEWADVVRRLARPNVRLSVSTYGLLATGADPVSWIVDHRDLVAHIELADCPGGGEPGSGRLDWPALRSFLQLAPPTLTVGLAHGTSQPGLAGLQSMLSVYRPLLRTTTGAVLAQAATITTTGDR